MQGTLSTAIAAPPAKTYAKALQSGNTYSPIKYLQKSHLLHQYVCLELIGVTLSPVAFVLDVHHLDFAVPALRPGTTVTVQHEVIHVEAAED